MRSSLEVFDLATGAVRVVFQSNDLIEAPNWHPDGRFLVNGGGKLLWIGRDGTGPHRINIGQHNECNNDHGLSPDLTHIVFSDKTEAGASCIYTVPIEGGQPRRITQKVPSYWHGWSPDGATLAYTCRRGAHFHIATIPVQGGEETIIADAPAHHDGPDYTSDGEFIWFNSDRGGTMDLWRIRPDGTSPEQMTNDERVNWFPHPSPDGKHVLFLAYEDGTTGHPRDRDVELRLMPAEGGKPRVLLSMFGGQGTINVPCWSPDSKAFAFMRYEAHRPD